MNEKNLVPNSKRTPSERRRIAVLGGKASGEARRKQKTLRQLAQTRGMMPLFDKDGKPVIDPITGEEVTIDMAVICKLYEDAMTGNTKSIELVAKLRGELKNNMEISGANGDPIQLQPLPPQPLTAEELRVSRNSLEADITNATTENDA